MAPVSLARTSIASAASSSIIITASIVSLRAVITAGVHRRRTVANSSGTEAVPARASGSFSVVELNPSSFTLATCSQRSTGGLSIETLPPGSNAPKKKL